MRAAGWVYVGVAMGAVVAYPFVPATAQEYVYLGSSLAVVGALCWGLRANRPSLRTPWVLLIAALTFYFIGDSVTLVLDRQLGDDIPFPSVADVSYLLFYPLTFVAMGRFLRASGNPDPAAWLDASMWTIGATVLLWEPLIEPYVVDSAATPAAYVVAMAYPLLDLGLLLMVVRMLGGRASLHPAFLLLSTGLAIQVVVDFVYGVRVVEDTYVAGELTDLGWLLVNLCLGAAAMHPSMVRLTQRASSSPQLVSRRRLQALVAPALLAPALLVYQLRSGDLVGELQDGLFTAGATALLFLLALTRGGGLLAVAEHRSRELVDRQLALEGALADRERAGRELRRRVDRDTLTGLSSRDRFVELLAADVASWYAGGETPSIAFLDLDDFKTVNDTLGHGAGDLLLVEVGNRLRAVGGSPRLVARFGGDEFAILMYGDAEAEAEQLLAALRPTVVLNGRELRPEVSIGVTTAAGPGCTPEDMLRQADVAMYTAKRAGGGWARYQPGMSKALLGRLDLRNRLVRALEAREIEPWFQPVVSLDDGTILGFETLARWRTGSTILEPAEWFALAEETGLVTDVDRLMLHAAVEQFAAWRRAGFDGLDLAINMSGRTLQQPGIDAEVLAALRTWSVPAARLVVEVTEGVLIDDADVGARLQRLRAAGVRIALDDFGTGWSSLSYLRRFPVDQIKLDCSFTAELGQVPQADAIPAAVMQLAHGLALDAVAEGVETRDQRDRLIALGFRVGQGYLFGRAQPGGECTALLAAAGAARPAPKRARITAALGSAR